MEQVKVKLNRAMRRLARRKGIKYTMAEETKERTLTDVQNDYRQQAAILGDVFYRLNTLENDAERMFEKMRELNQEAATLAAKEQANGGNKQAEAPATNSAE